MPFSAFIKAVKDNAGGVVLAVIFGFGIVGLYYDVAHSHRGHREKQAKATKEMLEDIKDLDVQVQTFRLQSSGDPKECDELPAIDITES